MNINEAAALLAEFMKAGEKATPGPWNLGPEARGTEVWARPSDRITICRNTATPNGSHQNAVFIAASRQVPDALRVVLEEFVGPAETLVKLDEILDLNHPDAQVEIKKARRLLDALAPLIEEKP